MVDLRSALLASLLWVASCDVGPASVAPKAEPPAASQPIAAPVPQAPEPERELDVVEHAAAGECASRESCSAAASDEERQGHHARAVPLYARACDLGLGQACHRLGELYRDGKGVAPDDDRARALFEQGCRQDSSAACDALGH